MRDHLIGVHVRRRTRASLVDVQNELLIPCTIRNFIRSCNDRLCYTRIKVAQFKIGLGSRFLYQTHSLNKTATETLTTDRKILYGALSLRTVACF